jgi:hypothetical protein
MKEAFFAFLISNTIIVLLVMSLSFIRFPATQETLLVIFGCPEVSAPVVRRTMRMPVPVPDSVYEKIPDSLRRDAWPEFDGLRW